MERNYFGNSNIERLYHFAWTFDDLLRQTVVPQHQHFIRFFLYLQNEEAYIKTDGNRNGYYLFKSCNRDQGL